LKVCVFGGGSIGGLIAAKLSQVPGVEVSMVARGEQLAAVSARGIELHSPTGNVHAQIRVTDKPEELGVQDYVFITLKSHQLLPAVPQIKALMGSDTVVLPPTTGIPYWYFHGLAGQASRTIDRLDPGGLLWDTPTLTFIIAGELNLSVGDNAVLRAGDVLLTSPTALSAQAVGSCRLVQLAVTPDWPAPDATEQDSGTIVQRARSTPHLRRMDRDAEGRCCSTSFDNLFPTELDRWSQTTPVTGFRFLCFPDGAFIDWHPEVVNNLAIFLSGDMEIEIGGTGPRIDHFLAGDVLLAADRTGEGHIDRMHGVIHLALIVIEDEHLWPIQHGE
jgi:hypothetical protein